MRNIFITGTSSGIGYDLVKTFVQLGENVIAVVRKIEDEKKLLAEFKNIHVLRLDLSDLNSIDQIPQILEKTFQVKNLDVLINNAGIALAAPFLDQDFSEVQSILNLNVLSVMKVTQVLLPLLGARPDSQHAGRIINISSVAGVSGAPFLAAYVTSKHAIEGFSQSLRKELMLFGIQVVVIGPGSIRTPIWQKGFQIIKDKYARSVYANAFSKFIRIAGSEEFHGLDVSEVSKIAAFVVQSKNPQFRYAPIPRKWINWYLPKIIPERFYNHLTAKTLGLMK